MSRRQRQLDELRSLCRSGAVLRAIDLAFAHFADFGRDDEVLRLLASSMEHAAVDEDVRARFSDLTSAR